MSKSNIPPQIISDILSTIMGNLAENLEKSMMYSLFGLIAHDYNKNKEGGDSLQQIFIKNWKEDIKRNMMNPELKRIGKELNQPHFHFDSIITDTNGLCYEDLVQLWSNCIRATENHFLEATGDGRDLENDDDNYE